MEMKNLFGFALISFLTLTSGVMRSRFKSMKCTVFNKTVLTNNFCYVKSYSRTYVTLNWGETRHLPVGRPIDVIVLHSSQFSFYLIFMFLDQNCH